MKAEMQEKPHTINVDVSKCARCQGDHFGLIFTKLTNAADEYAYWASCPTSSQPILLRLMDAQ